MNQVNLFYQKQVSWKEDHAAVPPEIHSLILKKLKPFELLIASQVNKGWRLQIDRNWRTHSSQVAVFQVAMRIWLRYTSLSEAEIEKLEELCNRLKSNYGFQNQHLVSTIILYQNLFLRLNYFTLQEATSIFHENYGMPIEKVMESYFKSCKNNFDIQLGSLSYIEDLNKESTQKFIATCINSGHTDLVMSHLTKQGTDFQKMQLQEYAIELLNRTEKDIFNKKVSNNLEFLLTHFFEKACDEIKNNPSSPLAKRVDPIIKAIFNQSRSIAELAEQIIYDSITFPTRNFYAVKWLLGFGCVWTIIPKLLGIEVIARVCGLATKHITYNLIQSDMINQLISAFPEYKTWQQETFYLCDLHQMLSNVRISLAKSNFCPLSQKVLTHAVKTPEGKIFDLMTLVKELEKNPKKYAFTKKDLKPDFEKIRNVYKDIIKSIRLYIVNLRDRTPRTGDNHLEMDRFDHLSNNAHFLAKLFEKGMSYSFNEVQAFCTKEQEDFLNKNSHLELLYAEDKISINEYLVYKKYKILKNEIKQKFYYHLSLKEII